MHTDVCSVRVLGNIVGEEALGFSRTHSRIETLMYEQISLLFLPPWRLSQILGCRDSALRSIWIRVQTHWALFLRH